MIALINKLLDWFKALFWKEEMELTLVGLQYSGKTTFVNVIAVSWNRCWSRCWSRPGDRQLASGRVHCFPAAVRSAGLPRGGDESVSSECGVRVSACLYFKGGDAANRFVSCRSRQLSVKRLWSRCCAQIRTPYQNVCPDLRQRWFVWIYST